MTDQIGLPGVPQVPQPLQGTQPPPTMNAGHILLAAGATEVSVMLGQTRLMPTPPAGGQNGAIAFVEWFATITMSPVVAQQLREGLDLTLSKYVEQFGPIPKGQPARVSGSLGEPTPKKAKRRK